jgi:hypothetical protein
MGTAIFNLVVGIVAIVAGLSGRFMYPTITIVVGVAIAGLGLAQLIRSRR